MHNTDELFQEYGGRVLNVSNGNLVLTACKNEFYSSEGETSFEKHKYLTVGSVTTENTMSFKYGKLEVRAKVPFKAGCWPSLWLRSHHATGKQENPNYELEIDIFEVFGAADRLRANLHQQCINGESGNSKMTNYRDEEYVFANSENLSNEFHIYGFEWTPEKMSVSVDGVVFCTWNLDVASLQSYGLLGDVSGFDTTLNILFNNHLFTASSEYIEGELIEDSESNLPAEYVIDYVRLYQKNDGLSKIYFN